MEIIATPVQMTWWAPQRQRAESCAAADRRACPIPLSWPPCQHDSPEAALGVTCTAAKPRGFPAQLSRAAAAAKADQVTGFLCLLITLYEYKVYAVAYW